MRIRLLLAAADQETQDLLDQLLDAALKMVSHQLEVARVYQAGDLVRRVQHDQDDVVILDWQLVGAQTPNLVGELVQANAKIRTVVLLPLALRQYRQRLWDAGACSSIPKEHLDQEWVSSLLCLISRAMDREARALSAAPAQPALAGAPTSCF